MFVVNYNITSKPCGKENIAVFHIPSALSVTTDYTVTTIPFVSSTFQVCREGCLSIQTGLNNLDLVNWRLPLCSLPFGHLAGPLSLSKRHLAAVAGSITQKEKESGSSGGTATAKVDSMFTGEAKCYNPQY